MTAVAAPARVDAAPRGAWVQSPSWDLFWMFSALWGGALLLVGWAVQPVMAVALMLLAAERLVSVLHAWSTTYMVLFSPLLADARRRSPIRYLGVPALLVAACFGLGLVVATGQRFPADGRLTAELWPFALYVGVFWVGHFWHFGNQDFGVLTIYRQRAGQTRPVERHVDKAFTIAMMYVIQPIVYLSVIRTTAFADVAWTLIPLSNETARAMGLTAVAVAALLSVGVAIYELSKPNRSLPKLLYVFVIFLHPTLLWGSVAAGEKTLALVYVFAYVWSHWLIAIGLVGRINSHYYASQGDTPRVAVARHAAVLLFIAGLVFLATERHAELQLFNLDAYRYKEVLAAITPEQSLVAGLVLGFLLGEQVLHYYCDRCLFRFRNPEVRSRVAPLLLGGAPER